MSYIWAFELTAAVDGAGTLKTFYCSTEKLVTGGADTPAHTAFLARVIRPGAWSLTLFEPRSTGGAATRSVGEIALSNVDGRLDGWYLHGWAGRPVVIRIGRRGAAYPSAWGVVLRGTIADVVVDGDEVVVTVADRLANLDVPAGVAVYAGSNVLPAGVEGADDLAGRAKPLAWGVVRNAPLACVNTSRLIYQVAPVLESVTGVFDRGVALTAGATYSSQAAMEATAPAAGQYRAWLAGGCIRLGATPSGEVTADAVAGSGNAARAGSVLAVLAAIAGQSVNAADVAALDALAPYALGLHVPAGDTVVVRDLMDRVAGSVGAWYVHDKAGIIRMGRLSDPAGAAEYTRIDAWRIKGLKRVAMRDGGNVPAWRVRVGYRPCWAVQTDLAAGAGDARRAFCGRAERVAVASSAAVKVKHLQAADIDVSTLIDVQADAAAEAARLLALYSVQRSCFMVELGEFDDLLSSIGMGGVVQVFAGRFGLSAGKFFVVIGVAVDRESDVCTLTLWG